MMVVTDEGAVLATGKLLQLQHRCPPLADLVNIAKRRRSEGLRRNRKAEAVPVVPLASLAFCALIYRRCARISLLIDGSRTREGGRTMSSPPHSCCTRLMMIYICISCPQRTRSRQR